MSLAHQTHSCMDSFASVVSMYVKKYTYTGLTQRKKNTGGWRIWHTSMPRAGKRELVQ